MIKIAALNEESEEESDSEEEVTREALEQIALQQYAKALDLQRKGNLSDAMQLLNDLLVTELLYEVKKPAPGEKSSEPLFNLKYLCYKNVASMQSSIGENEKAIESYTAASELDDTDVTLWYRFGLTCIRAQEYEKALYAFQQGTNCNPRHWPCIDKIVTLQMALGFYNDCIETIYNALELDSGYLRGLAYRKHIYCTYHYVRDFLIFLDPKYKWNEENNEHIDDSEAEKLLKEAEEIHNVYIEQINKEKFKYILPQLKLKKPITNLTWQAVGDSLVNMHHYMTEHCYSHACIVEINYEEPGEAMEVCEEPIPVPEETDKPVESTEMKIDESVAEEDKNMEIVSDDNNELSDKTATDTEKVEESDIEVPALETTSEVEVPPQTTETKEPNKKPPARRRGSALSFLQQWEWYTKRRSGRKKTSNKQHHDDESIYETLRKMVPQWLVSDKSKENSDKEKSPEIIDISNLFENVPKDANIVDLDYFGSEVEQKDVKEFIQKYILNKCDIIEMLQEYLHILSQKWKINWASGLSKTFVEANKCYANHIEMPSCSDQNKNDIIHYTFVNILCEEFVVADKLSSHSDEKQNHELDIIENIGIVINNKPSIYGADCFELMLRYLWVKLHIHLINKLEEQALDCLYRLIYEFESMGDHHDTYSLQLRNFKYKPLIKESEVKRYITFLERNKKLSTVLDLYDNGSYEDVLTIVTDSFNYCKNNARTQEEEMSLDFAVQLSLLIDCTWALKRVDYCFKWSITCLHEALKHYFLSQPESAEHEQWTKTTVKILCSIEHILKTEGLLCLDNLTQKELSDALEDLIRIIGHQVDTNATEMPLGTIAPWLIMHYILQREDDHGRSRCNDKDSENDEIPNPILILFVAHEHLGNHSWCTHFDAKLLYFILDTIVPRLRSPSLSPSLEQVIQNLEQCVFCLFGHPGKKTKLKYLLDHKVTPHSLDWLRAQQIYEIFRPPSMPELEGKVPSISAETEQLFHRILAIIPADCEPRRYVPQMEEYLNGKVDKLPEVPPLLPFKMKDIYFLLGDYYFKKEERKRSVKFNVFDVIVNSDRFESWAEIALAKGVNLELKLNSCTNLDNERDYLDPARVIIRCFKRALELDSMYVNLWVEYGVFVYTVYSFCSRLLKHASESLSMQDFDSLEKQKEIMLDQTQKCFTTVLQQGRLNASNDEKDKENDEMWLHYYMMGKVAEKRNKSPSVYLNYYTKAIKSLEEADAIYPSKINYNSPQHLSIEVLEIHYRIHASILKFIEQHENKPIPVSVGKVFLNSMKEWKNGPFAKKPKKDDTVAESDAKLSTDTSAVHQAGNILKRSISDAGEEENQESKKLKLESAAAKVKRSASYDTERVSTDEIVNSVSKVLNLPNENQNVVIEEQSNKEMDTKEDENNSEKASKTNGESNTKENKTQQLNEEKNEDTVSGTSTMSSSDSSSDDTSSDSTTSTSRDTDVVNKPIEDKNMTDNDIMEVIFGCLDALEDCSSRFPQHYKAIYRLAHYHFYYKKGKDIERCRDLMLSNFTSRSNQKLGGLFNERKQTNFFNSVWRIPSMEVDRPGGFAYHMNRCVLLTMEILKQIDDHKTLLELSMHLLRVPDPDKKYLRDVDREDLAQQAFLLCVQSLKGQLLKFSQQLDLKSNEIEKQAFNSLMLDIHRAYLKAQKQPNSKQFLNLLIDGYKLICPTPINENANLADISLKYCQSLITALKQKATLASIDKNNQNAQKKQAAAAKAAAANIAIVTTANSHSETTKTTSQSKVDKSTLPALSKQDLAALMQNYHPLVSSQAAAAAMLLYGGYDNYSLPSVTQASLQSQLQNPLSSLPVSLQNALSTHLQGTLPSAITNPLQSSLHSLQNPLQPSLMNSLQNPLQSLLSNPLQNSYQSEFYRLLLTSQYSQYNLSPPKKQRAKYTSSKSNSSGHVAQTKNVSRPYSSASTSAHTSHSRSIPTAVTAKNSSASSSYISHTKSNPGVSTNIMSSYTSLPNSRSGSSAFGTSHTSHKNKTGSLSNAFSTSYSTHSRTSNSTVTTSSRNITKMTSSTLPSMTHNRSAYPHTSTLGNKINQPKSTNYCTIELTPINVNTAKPAHTQSSSQNLYKSTSLPLQAHISTSSTVNAALHTKPPLPHQQVSPGKTLQQKLAERQKHSIVKPSVQEINASLNRLPSSLTVTKTVNKKLEVVKSVSYDKEAPRAKPTLSTDEIIVLDDDD